MCGLQHFYVKRDASGKPEVASGAAISPSQMRLRCLCYDHAYGLFPWGLLFDHACECLELIGLPALIVLFSDTTLFETLISLREIERHKDICLHGALRQ